jgi:transcriptional regulator with XRE-family HTH domain
MHVKPLAKTGGSLASVIDMDAAPMSDPSLRKSIGSRIKAQRKAKGWTQKELATKVGIRHELLNKYEMGLCAPPVEKLVGLAEALDTSSDFLLVGEVAKDQVIRDVRFQRRFEAVQDLGPEDQQVVIHVIDALLVKHRVEGAVKPVDRPKRLASR